MHIPKNVAAPPLLNSIEIRAPARQRPTNNAKQIKTAPIRGKPCSSFCASTGNWTFDSGAVTECSSLLFRLQEEGDFLFQQYRVADIEFDQTAQMGDAVEVHAFALDADLQAFNVGDAAP